MPDSDCTECDYLQLQATLNLSALTGCYWTGKGGNRSKLQVWRITEDVFTLDIGKSYATQMPVVLATAGSQDIKTVTKGLGIHVNVA